MNTEKNDLSTTTGLAFAAGQCVREKEYWLEKLAGEPVKSSFPSTASPLPPYSREKASREFNFPAKLVTSLQQVTKGLDHRLHVVLGAALTGLLARYTGSNDILIGAPIYRVDEKENLDRLLNRVLVLRNQVAPGMTFKELLLQFRQTMAEADENQNYPMSTLLQELDLVPGPGAPAGEAGQPFAGEFPLFDVAVLLESLHDVSYLEGIEHNMDFCFQASNENLSCVLKYHPQRWNESTIDSIISHYLGFLEIVLENMEFQVLRIDFLSEQEKHQLLVEFNNTAAPYPGEKTIDALFEEQVARTPDSPALLFEEQSYTYAELNRKAHQVASFLRCKPLRTGEPVGIMSAPCLEMVAAVIGILKAGFCYLPINPEYPLERQQYLLNDGNARILLAGSQQEGHFTQEVDYLDAPTLYYRHDEIKKSHDANTTAYIMYTSGSTGVPKGIMVEHHCVTRLVINTNFIQFKEDDRILQTGALEFDASTFEIWGALLNGLVLCLAPRASILDARRLKETIAEKNVTTMWMTAPLFNHVLDTDSEVFAQLRNLLVGGDVLSVPHINKLQAQYPHLAIINGYGPTENTTFSTTHRIDRQYEGGIPIGKPIANSTAYMVDSYGQPVPIGVTGELWVGGDGIARGYLNNPELTEDKFFALDKPDAVGLNKSFDRTFSKVRPPAGAGTGLQARACYKTGDLARWLADGTIDFLGRSDFQVKIRGFRIELGDIETRIMAQGSVKEAVVMAREKAGTGDKEICAYVVPIDGEAGKEFQVQELREYLIQKLPDYMIPSYFVPLDKIPLNQNGKVDRKALPQPTESFRSAGKIVPPANETEQLIHDTWAEILNLPGDCFGIHDDFFALGGNSINILKVQSRLNQELGLEISMSDMFLYPTIIELADNISDDAFLKGLKNIVKLNKAKDKRNIFIFHPMHGMVYPYRELAELLEDSFTVYGIQAKGLTSEEPLPQTFKEVLDDYLPQLRAVQEKGPYIIAGYCIGAMIGYEAVRILEDQGETIEKLVMLDIRAFIANEVVPFYRFRKTMYEIFDFNQKVKSFFKGIFRRDKKTEAEAETGAETDTPKGTQTGTQTGTGTETGAELDAQELLKQRVKANNEFLDGKYKYKRIVRSPILHVRAEENRGHWLRKEDWEKMSSGPVQCLVSPGDHDSMLMQPHVKRLAQIIRDNIK